MNVERQKISLLLLIIIVSLLSFCFAFSYSQLRLITANVQITHSLHTYHWTADHSLCQRQITKRWVPLQIYDIAQHSLSTPLKHHIIFLLLPPSKMISVLFYSFQIVNLLLSTSCFINKIWFIRQELLNFQDIKQIYLSYLPFFFIRLISLINFSRKMSLPVITSLTYTQPLHLQFFPVSFVVDMTVVAVVLSLSSFKKESMFTQSLIPISYHSFSLLLYLSLPVWSQISQRSFLFLHSLISYLSVTLKDGLQSIIPLKELFLMAPLAVMSLWSPKSFQFLSYLTSW